YYRDYSEGFIMTSDTEQLAALDANANAEGSREASDASTEQPVPSNRQRYLQRKYTFERILGCLLLLPAAPVILFVCLLVKLTSKGPALYRQVRLGHNRKSYEILKIRTMRLDAEADGVAR